MHYLHYYVSKNRIGFTYDVHDRPSTVLSVHQCGWQIGSFSYGPAESTCFLIHYVVHGKMFFTCNGKTHHLQEHQLCLFPPHQAVSYGSDGDENLEYFWVGFNGSEAKAMLEKANLSADAPVFSCDPNGKVQYYMEQIYRSSQSTEYAAFQMIGYLYLLFSCLVTAPIKKHQNQEEYIKTATEYIESHCLGHLTNQKVANHVGLERSYLFRIFKKEMGYSVSEYILNRKIVRAKNFLSKTNMSITEIANSLGFSSATHFCVTFKKVTCCTPTVYRKFFSNNHS